MLTSSSGCSISSGTNRGCSRVISCQPALSRQLAAMNQLRSTPARRSMAARLGCRQLLCCPRLGRSRAAHGQGPKEVAPPVARRRHLKTLVTSSSSAACLAVALLDLRPVDDVPEGVDVVRTLVLVLQVVSVLPHVDTEQWRIALHER